MIRGHQLKRSGFGTLLALSLLGGSALALLPRPADAWTINRTIWEETISVFNQYSRGNTVTVVPPPNFRLFPQYAYGDGEGEQRRAELERRCYSDLKVQGYSLGRFYQKSAERIDYGNYVIQRSTYACFGQREGFTMVTAVAAKSNLGSLFGRLTAR